MRALDVNVTMRPEFRGNGFRLTSADIVHMRLGVVVPAIGRWRSLTIRCEQYGLYFWNTALSSLCAKPGRSSTYAPKLEALSLVYPYNDDSKEYLLFGNYAPMLQHAVVCGIRLKWTSSLFGNLVTLNYTHHGFSRGREAVFEVLSMLYVSRLRLKNLSLTMPNKGGDQPFEEWFEEELPNIELRSLQTLVLRACRTPQLELEMLSYHILHPRLQTLELSSSSRGLVLERRLVRSVTRAFVRHPTLRNIGISSGWNDEQSMTVLFGSLPNLQTVRTL